MGWYGSYATKFDKRGNIDRKAEMRAKIKEGTIIKDALVGATYYAAFGDGEHCLIFVAKTSVNEKTGEFFYKPMDSSMGPCYYDCPESILKLSTADDDTTQEWIAICREKAARKKAFAELNKTAKIIKVVMPFNTTYYEQGATVMLHKVGKNWYAPTCRFTLPLVKQLFDMKAVTKVE